MIKNSQMLGLVLGIILLGGCAAVPTQPTARIPSPEKAKGAVDASLVEKYRGKAAVYEKSEELRKAMLMYEVVLALNPTDSQTQAHIAGLKKKSVLISKKHFDAGMVYFSNHEYLEARKAFLLSLYFDPQRREALEYLKEKIPGDVYTEVTVGDGDTLKGIASQAYADAEKAFVVAFYNDVDGKERLSPGTRLKLPVIDFIETPDGVYTEGYFTGISFTHETMAIPQKSETIPQKAQQEKPLLAALPPDLPEKPVTADTTELDREVAYADKLLNNRKYLEAIPISERILSKDANHQKAREILNESAYQAGNIMLASKSFDKALVFYKKVHPGYKDVAVGKVRATSGMADFHYLAGVRFFINEEVDKAIREWETTLSIDPGYAKASRDLENARMVQRRLKEIQ